MPTRPSQETKYTIAQAERCRFVFLSHARAVVDLDELTAAEVQAFAELAEPKTELALIEGAGPRFRHLWSEHMAARKATSEATDAITDAAPQPAAQSPTQPAADSNSNK